MRISSVINSIENGLITATKATGRQARRISHALSVELAASRIADGEAEKMRLAARGNIEAAEIDIRADELLLRRANDAQLKTVKAMRRELARMVLQGAPALQVAAHASELESLCRMQRLSNDAE